MAKRSSSFRKQVLEADRYECQKCGSTSNLEADHVVERGMGGIPSRDEIANGITLCARCHRQKTEKLWFIERWERDDLENGLVIRLRDGAYMPKGDIWFYLRQERDKVKEETALLTNLSLSEGARAMMLWHVYTYYYLVEPGTTPDQYVASIGLDPVRAREEAELAGWLKEKGVVWPDGVNAAKVALIREAGDLSTEEMTAWLNKARDSSYSDLARELFRAGFLPEKRSPVHLYAQVPFEAITWRFSDDETAIERKPGHVLLRVSKVYSPLRRARGKLYLRDGLIEREIA